MVLVLGAVGDHHIRLQVGVDDRRCPVDRHGQAHHHRAPASRGVLEVELTTHRFDEATGHGQTEPDPRPVVGVTEPLEGQEHEVPVGRSDARPVVDDPEIDPVGHPTHLHPDGLARPVEECIVDQIGDHALDQRLVRLDQGHGGVDRHAAPVGTRPEAGQGTVDEVTYVGRAGQDLHGPGLQPAHVEEILHQLTEPVGFVVDGV